MVKKHVLAEAGSPSSPVLSLAEGKAAVLLAAFRRTRIAWLIPQGEPFVLARGAYAQYVSTAKGRPACHNLGVGWRLFSTFPLF